MFGTQNYDLARFFFVVFFLGKKKKKKSRGRGMCSILLNQSFAIPGMLLGRCVHRGPAAVTRGGSTRALQGRASPYPPRLLLGPGFGDQGPARVRTRPQGQVWMGSDPLG